MNNRLLGALLTGSAVVLGAWGAHGLAAVVGEDSARLSTWDTAVLYQFIHALAILIIGSWKVSTLSKWAVRFFAAGVVLFSGSLYWLTLGAPGWVGPVTPLGGTAFIVGWMLLSIDAFRNDSVSDS